MEIVAIIGLGFLAGIVAGLFGVGGGVVFVPLLVFVLGLNQAHAEATSLLAIVPVALVGSWRQRGYGNVRVRDGLMIGALCAPGAVASAALANALPEKTLKILFACLMVYIAVRMMRRALRPAEPAPA
ncbi:MAG TPA: sulfite exporter TauE/SafE family protein [Solirubrobacterales bacterium]|jgi:uncharacterized membrane protein YfcA|nr:sulfite exporter TauE/SafE family protein [Solirubrobacterales bacterium]